MGLKNKILNKIAKRAPIIVKNNYVEAGKEFSGKTAVVFGGGSGIGFAIANELKENGCDVIICGRRKYNYDEFVEKQIDASNFETLQLELEKVIEENRIDLVVNSQGILPECDMKQDFYSVSYDSFDSVLNVNLKSVFFINQFFCKYYEENNIEGHILNICSTEGLKGCVVPYGISKSAVISLTKGLGKRMISKGIVINGIAPGATATDMMKMDKEGDLRINYIPSNRATTPVEISKVAHLLLSDVGKQMCGQIVIVDGGESIH